MLVLPSFLETLERDSGRQGYCGLTEFMLDLCGCVVMAQ